MMSRFPKTQKAICCWDLGFYRALPVKSMQIQSIDCRCSRVFSCSYSIHLDSPPIGSSRRIVKWRVRSRAGINEPGSRSQEPTSGESTSSTRLIRVLQSLLLSLTERIQKLRKGLPMKVLSFLVGFYCATAFTTVIGQTGDWDILSAGFSAMLVEGIGALMYKYKASFSFADKFRSVITVFNFWKAGLSLGLFLDAFKYEIDIKFPSICNPFDFEFDFLPVIW